MTSASGTFTSCGFGQPFSLQFTCTGTGCSLVDDFPGTTCTTDGTTLSCTNGVVCPGSNYTTTFNVDQPLNAITQSMQIMLSDACTEFDVTNNGTQSGVLVQSLPIANCTPETSSLSSSSSLLSSTSSTTIATTILSSSTSSTSPSSASTLSSNGSTSNSVGTSSAASTNTPCSSSINSLSSGSSTSGSIFSEPTKGTSETSTPMTTIVVVTSGVTSTITVPCSEGSETPNRASVAVSSPCSTCVVSNSITISNGEPQALFASKPIANSSISGTGTPVLGSAAAGYLTKSDNVLLTGSPTGTTSKSPAQTIFTSSASSCRKRPHLNVYSLIIVLFAFLHLATALDNDPGSSRHHDAVNAPLLPRDMTPNPFSTSALMQRGEGSLGAQFTEILEDWVAGKITTPSVASTLAAEIYSAICSHYASAAITAGAFPEVAALLEYLSLVFDTIALPTGPEGWLLAFTFTVMVNVLVNELFPMIQQMADQACEAAEETVLCSTHFQDDAMNCGFCGNQCPSGICSNSACVSNTCTGETCETFTPCGPGGTCVCASTAEGTGFCVDGSTPCAGLQTCDTSSDCPAGVVCAVASCCAINVCVGATTCGGANATSAAKFLFSKDVDGLTFGHLY